MFIGTMSKFFNQGQNGKLKSVVKKNFVKLEKFQRLTGLTKKILYCASGKSKLTWSKLEDV